MNLPPQEQQEYAEYVSKLDHAVIRALKDLYEGKIRELRTEGYRKDATIKAYEGQITAMNEALCEKHEEIHDLHQLVTGLRLQRNEQDDQIASLEKQLKEARGEVDRVEGRNNNNKRQPRRSKRERKPTRRYDDQQH
jgi:predicted  nucleic acid-binding Zn-ribbon protein